ncbi:hypothetical protein F2Q70_00044844 [Brassica cretica]|uniref:Uncharacterized protein n=1 Tax=Brassica cretica TaxID=69181 RepID=A0A8S9KE31_BRACR|nr:hypothetical protein F2Q70_00044844 [Brassica cretica]
MMNSSTFQADLTVEGSFDEEVNGVHGVSTLLLLLFFHRITTLMRHLFDPIIKRHNQCDELLCKCSNNSQRIGLTSSCSLTQCRFSAIKASTLD